jgi:ABC-type glycerol-3-phosphate transport system substrate-binding protein
MNRSLLIATRRLLAATAIALVLAACGGGNTPTSHSSTTATSSTGSHGSTGSHKPASKAPGY